MTLIVSEFRPAARVARIRAAYAGNARAAAVAASGRDVINLTVGEPGFEPPAHVQEAAIAAIQRGETRYPPCAGIPALREAIAAGFTGQTGLDFHPAQVLVGNGAKQLIANAFAATVDDGDEVAIPVPYWPSFPEATAFAGGRPVFIPCHAENRFKLDPADLDAALGRATRWLVLNLPANPTGTDYDAAELAAIAEVLRRHPRVLILLDEVYDRVRFGAPPPHLLRVAPDLRDRVLLINAVSKTYAMTGWRVGYAAGPAPLIAAMTAVQSQFCIGVCPVAQAAALAALTGPQDFVATARTAYAARRRLVIEGFARIPGFDLTPPEGAFFAFPSVAGLIGTIRPDGRPIASDVDVADYLLEDAGVAVMPGAAFGLSPFLRVSFAADAAQVAEALRRVAAATAALRPARPATARRPELALAATA